MKSNILLFAVVSSDYAFLSAHSSRSSVGECFGRLAVEVRIIQHVLVLLVEWMSMWHHAGLGVCRKWSPEQKNKRLWSMNFVVDPATGLLNTERTPFSLKE